MNIELPLGFSVEDDLPLLKQEPDNPYLNESYNLWVYDPQQRVGVHTQLLVQQPSSETDPAAADFVTRSEVVVLFIDDKIYCRTGRGRGTRAEGPGALGAFATVLEPFKSWRHEFLGTLWRTNAAETATVVPDDTAPQVLAGYDLTSEMAGPPVIQGSQGDNGVTSGSGTIPRTARRYEQLLQARGTVRVGSRDIAFEGLGLRVHRRNSASIYESGAVGHTWAAGLFPSGRGFHLLARRHRPDGHVGFRYGHYFDGDRYHDAEVVEFPHFTGASDPERYELVLQADGKTITVQGEGIPPYLTPYGFRSRSEIDPKTVLFSRAPGRFVLDGEVGGGIFERSLQTGLMAES